MKHLIFFISIFSMLGASAASMNPNEFRPRDTQRYNNISEADVIKSAKSDSIVKAAFLQAKGCKARVTQKPKVPSDIFIISLECSEEDNEYTGGGIYLLIEIQGQYFDKESSDIQNIKIQRAG